MSERVSGMRAKRAPTVVQLKGAESWVTPVFNGGILLLAVAVANVSGTRRLLWRGRNARGPGRAEESRDEAE